MLIMKGKIARDRTIRSGASENDAEEAGRSILAVFSHSLGRV
jgi:hypothetical protein